MNKIIPFLILCFLTYSCGKLELPDSSSQKGKDKAGKVETPENTTCQDTLSVTEALTNGKEDSYYAIVGYIVGYGNGHSKSFSFGLPDKSTPCLIIADTKVESEHVLPINIGSTNSEFRKKLDLYFHPELLGKKVMVCGFLSRYYGTLGIKKLYGFEIQEGSDSETTPTQPKTNLPQLEEQEQTLEGR